MIFFLQLFASRIITVSLKVFTPTISIVKFHSDSKYTEYIFLTIFFVLYIYHRLILAFKLYRFHFLFPPNTLLKVLENFILILNNQFGINQHVLASHFYLFSNKENNFKLKLKYGDFRRKRKKGGKKKEAKIYYSYFNTEL